MPDFTRVINLAYQRILGRPADPGGLDAYNRSMNAGQTEADMRESLLRSAEYAANHPDRSASSEATIAASKAKGGKAAKKSKTRPKPKPKAKTKTKSGSRTSGRKKRNARAGRSD